MVGKVFRRAVADTARGQLVALFMLVAGGGLSLLYLYVTESPTVAAEEIPYVSGAIVGALGAGVLLFLINLVLAPFRMMRDRAVDAETRLFRAEDALNRDAPLPEPVLEIVKEGLTYWLKITNHSADAIYTVKFDLSHTDVVRAPKTLVHAQWADDDSSLSKEIPAGAWDKVFLMKSDIQRMTSVMHNQFAWAGQGFMFGHTTSWVPGNKDTIKPTGIVTIYISSKPPMRGGPRKIVLSYEGSEIDIISGEVGLPR